jgi:hypothetical protein
MFFAVSSAAAGIEKSATRATTRKERSRNFDGREVMRTASLAIKWDFSESGWFEA